MATSGQTLNDRINAARYALAGQGLARCVCKATTEEVIGPKKKHLDYLLACTHEQNVSIPQLANLLIERTNHIYWVVVFKALVTVHHLMSYGNERFTQYLASSNYSFELSTFLDKTSASDFSMSRFIRRYSRYINEKALSYRLLAFDFCKVKRGSEGVLRLMPIDRLLKTLPILQSQLDALLEFDCTTNDLNNGVINACFMLLFRDLIGLFACHNDGIINLLNKYFNLNKKMCREAFEHYKKFLVRMDKVSEFLRVAEAVGIDKDEIPDLRRTPSSLVEALEQHLQNLESNKKILKQQQSINSNTNNNGNSSKSGTGGDFPILGNLTPPSSAHRPHSPNNSAAVASSSATAGSSVGADDFSISSFKDDEVRKALEEEARVLSQYGSDGSKISKSNAIGPSKGGSGGNSASGDNSPKFAVTTIPKRVDDVFGDSDSFLTNTQSHSSSRSESMNSNNASVFDNLSSTNTPKNQATSFSNNANAKTSRPDLNSIKSAIQSATTTLEKSNSQNARESASKSAPKKASDELLSLLDMTAPASAQATPATAASNAMNSGSSFMDPMSKLSGVSTMSSNNNNNPLTSAFIGSSPFDLPLSNDKPVAPMKSGNPFPSITSDFGGPSAFPVAFPTAPMAAQPSNSNDNNNSAFKSSSMGMQQTAPNYTNLGVLDGFGELLQPSNMSTSNKVGSKPSAFDQQPTSKSTFNPSTGLSNTGLFKGDLDSTLANLAQNLTFEGINKTKK